MRTIDCCKWAVTITLLAFSRTSVAWEAAIADKAKTPLMESPPAPFPFSRSGFGDNGAGSSDATFPTGTDLQFYQKYSANNVFRFATRYIHDAHGGEGGAQYARLLFCKQKPLDTNFDAYQCRIATPEDDAPKNWLTPRKVWADVDSNDNLDEHAQLARQAASLAGLPSGLSATFWLRYPATNGYIATPVGGGWFVAPKWSPQAFGLASTNTTRSITLYELAQIPDHSLAIWDWAAAYEACPLDVSPEGFPKTTDPGNERCHDYLRTIGPLNATHFLPANKSVYAYYHDLALSRMAQCGAMNFDLSMYYEPVGPWEPVWSRNDTEVHACEREAMVYEMFAQHFLQDAWSTGHMWFRWGRSEPAEFPSYLRERYGVTWDRPSEIPTGNAAGRRALVSGLVAAFVGMVHGTKGILMGKVRANVPAPWDDRLLSTGLLNDPLSGPAYLEPDEDGNILTKYVHYRDSSGTVARGIGDLFVGAVLAGGDDQYQLEGDKLRMCTAMSMRQVYDVGPHAHGEPGAFSGRWSPADFDFDKECWSQRATNESMLGAVSPLPISYGLDKVNGARALFGLANDLVLRQYDDPPTMPNAQDRQKFLASLRTRMLWDQLSVIDAYQDNAFTDGIRDPQGTKSAEGQRKRVVEDSTTIDFLDVPPNRPLGNRPPVSFMDLDPNVNDGELSQRSTALSRMFWRAHPETTCEEPGLVASLRDACVAGAELPGGSPEACTQCVELAEMQMPICGLYRPELVQSKCSALGYENLGGIDPIYGTDPFSPPPNCLDGKTPDLPAYFAAFHYCTGTDPVAFNVSGNATNDTQLVGRRVISRTLVRTVDCNQVPGYVESSLPIGFADVYKWRQRIAVALNENAPQGASWVPPVVTALTEDVTSETLSDAKLCHVEDPADSTRYLVSSDDKLAALAYPLEIWDNYGKGLRAFTGSGWLPDVNRLSLEVCGITQRAVYTNRDCVDTLTRLGVEDEFVHIGMGQSQTTGFAANTASGSNQSRCSLRQERYLKPYCVEGTCNANGLCTSGPKPDIEFTH